MNWARVSVLTPTLNSSRTLGSCLGAIRRQTYPQSLIEIIIADGGSSDDTRAIARTNGAKIVENPLRTGEAGKAAALRHATGDFVAFIDSDNIIIGDDWLTRMLTPFENPAIMGAEPIAFAALRSDSLVDRYCALAGVNDPLCLFMGNYDKYSAFSGQWTEVRLHAEECDGYLHFALDQVLPTIGANGTVYRRSALNWFFGDYFMDVDVPTLIARHLRAGRFAKVRTSIRHLYCSSVRQFGLKQTRRVRDYYCDAHKDSLERVYPWQAFARRGLIRFVLSTVSVVPLLAQSIKAYVATGERAAFFHPIACWITAIVYGMNLLFARGKALSRESWQAKAET